MDDNTPSPAPGDGITPSRSDKLESAIRTVSRHALKSGIGTPPGEQTAFTAAWSTTQLRLLLSYLERHAATVETALGSVQEPELKQAVGIVLKDAADRCALVSRDLDLARGEPMGIPPSKPAMVSRVTESRAAAAGSALSF